MKLCCWKLSLCCVVWLLLCVCVCVCVVCVCGVGCVRVVCVCVCMEIDTKQSHRTFNGTTLIHKSSDPVLYDFEISFFFFQVSSSAWGKTWSYEWSFEFRNLICIANASRLLTTSRQTLLPSFCEVSCCLCLFQGRWGGGRLTVFIFY